MFCVKCGMNNKSESSFCVKCGASLVNQATSINPIAHKTPQATTTPIPNIQQQDSPTNPKMKLSKGSIALSAVAGVVAAAVVFAILYFAVGLKTDSGTIEGTGYVSAEAAARAYLEAFGNADVKTMISTFSVESFANNYDLQAQIERLWAYNFFSLPQSLPSNNRLTTDLNIQRRQGLIANWIQYQYASVFFADDLNNGGAMTPFGDEREVDRFIERISDPTYYEAIQTLSIIDFVDLNSLSDMYSSDKNQQNIDSTSDIVGAQKIENVVARVDIDREIYLFCFDVASYDGRWYINSLGGNIGTLLGISSYNMGVIREIDVP